MEIIINKTMHVRLKGKKTYTSFEYGGKTYPARLIADTHDNLWIVASIELWDAISDSQTSDCKDEQAQGIDNKIFYYLNYGSIDKDDEAIIDEIGDQSEFDLRPLNDYERSYYQRNGVY